jgi:hypothetical protein
MNEALKFGLFAAGAGILFYIVNQSTKVAYSISGYGTPKLNPSNWQLSLPVKVQFTNPTPAPVNIDQVQGVVSLFKSPNYEQVGTINPQPITIAPGTSVVNVNTVLELKKFLSGNILETAKNILKQRQLQLRTDLRATYAGYDLPVQTFEKVINV